MTDGLTIKAEQQRLRAAARAHFLERYRTVSAAEILSGSDVAEAQLNRCVSEGTLLSIDIDGEQRFPTFQFGVGFEPLPVMREVLRCFQGEPPWTIALWLASPNGWLGGAPCGPRFGAAGGSG